MRRNTGWALLGAALLAVATGAAQDVKLPKGEEVLDQYVEALGGKAAFEKLKNRRLKGTFEAPAQQLKGTIVEYAAAPGKRHVSIELPIGRRESGTDGEVYWEIAPGGPRILTGDERARAERDATFNAIVAWRKLYPTAETTGTEEVDGQPCFKVELTPASGKPETWYFDRKTRLLVRRNLTVSTPMGEVAVESKYGDYAKADGILVARKITQLIPTLKLEQVITVESVDHNVDIPASEFELPEAVRALAAQEPKPREPAK